MHHKDNNLKDVMVVQHQIVLLLDQVIRCGQQSSMLNLLPRRLEPSTGIHSRKCSTHPDTIFYLLSLRIHPCLSSSLTCCDLAPEVVMFCPSQNNQGVEDKTVSLQLFDRFWPCTSGGNVLSLAKQPRRHRILMSSSVTIGPLYHGMIKLFVFETKSYWSQGVKSQLA